MKHLLRRFSTWAFHRRGSKYRTKEQVAIVIDGDRVSEVGGFTISYPDRIENNEDKEHDDDN